MFTKPLSYIITKKSLKEAYEKISKSATGLDEITFLTFEKEFDKNLENLIKKIQEGLYAPEPLKKIEIQKTDSQELRPIAISALKDKLVQRVLYDNLNPYFDKRFSDKSYAYRPDKSVIKALNRTTQFINQKYFFIVKSDIDDFFETIDHEILLKILDDAIADKKLIKLIALFMEIGSFQKLDYDEHHFGVHQGDILSPLLSNIYLDVMDKFLEKQSINFVRYADDFVMLFKGKKEAYKTLKELKICLKELKLHINKEKTEVVHISDGFIFLGVFFQGRSRSVAQTRLDKSLTKVKTLAKNSSGFAKFTAEINSYLFGLKNYYLKILLPDSKQFLSLQNNLTETLAHKVALSKKNKTVTTKKEFKLLLEQVKFSILFQEKSEDIINHIIAMGYEEYLANKSYKDTTKKIEKKRNKYAKKFANDATLHIATPGLMLGIAKNKFTLKQYGKVQKSFPLNKIKRIIFEGKGYSLSTNVIKKCADHGIGIDFIDRDALNYASLITYKAATTQIVQKQAKILNTPMQLQLAQAFITGKAKNQCNYLKNLDRYHKLLTREIERIEENIAKLKFTKTVNELMGHEGVISALYWDGLKLILEVPFEKRITFGARDIVNSSLNYGYAILYGKVQHALAYAGLSLNISFLHALDEKKPTLTFDMIEEFRTFIVDRTIISMLNKNEPIKLGNDGLLTKSSRQLIAKNIKEKLGSYTMWKKRSLKVENIIQTQAYNLAKVIQGEEKKYKPFVGKF